MLLHFSRFTTSRCSSVKLFTSQRAFASSGLYIRLGGFPWVSGLKMDFQELSANLYESLVDDSCERGHPKSCYSEDVPRKVSLSCMDVRKCVCIRFPSFVIHSTLRPFRVMKIGGGEQRTTMRTRTETTESLGGGPPIKPFTAIPQHSITQF